MKRLLTLIISISIGTSLWATHIVGGDIHYEYLGDDQYRVILKVYRDCGTSGTGFDNVADVGLYLGTELQFTIPMNLSDATTSFLPIDTGDPCLDPPDGLCVAEAIYEEIVDIPYQEGTFHLTYQRCCRNTTLVNCESNDDIGMTVTTQIPDQQVWGDNSTPGFVNFPPVVICLNEPFVFDHSAFDPDGDSLYYRMCNPLLTNVAGFEINTPGPPPYPELQFYPEYSWDYPLDADPAFSIDAATGLLTGTPTQLGQYVVGICVEEYRNGELMTVTNRDFQFNIALCSQDIVANVPDEEPCQGLDIDFSNLSVGELWSWDFGDLTTEGDTSSVFEPSYSYPDSGSYTITLIVNPGFACADTTTVEVFAFEPITADFALQDEWCENGVANFDFIVEGEYTDDATFDWEFEGGNPSTDNGFDPDAAEWTDVGTYTVTVNIWDHFCEASYSEEIEVTPPPIAAIAEQTEFCGGLTVDFSNLSQNASEYVWDFGEPGIDDISLEENPSHTYLDYGEYQVLLVADPETDCEDIDTLFFLVLPEDPIEFDFSITPPGLCDTTNMVFMNFTGSGQTDVWWDMGDGNQVIGTPATYVYDSPGLYTVTCHAEHSFCDYEEHESIDIFYGVQAIDRPVRVPNVFSPNADTKNDRFRVFYAGETPDIYPPGYNIFDFLENFSMKIYDRWGVLMHDSDAGDGGIWDGIYRNDPVVEGTYYYIITWQRACLDDGPTTETGELEVLRK